MLCTTGPQVRSAAGHTRDAMTHRRLRMSSPHGVAYVRVRDHPRRPLSSDPGEGTVVGDEEAWGWLAVSSAESLSKCAFPKDSDVADVRESPSPLSSVICVVEAIPKRARVAQRRDRNQRHGGPEGGEGRRRSRTGRGRGVDGKRNL